MYVCYIQTIPHFSYNIGKPLIWNTLYSQLIHIYVIPINSVFRLIKGQIITISIALWIIIEILTMKLWGIPNCFLTYESQLSGGIWWSSFSIYSKAHFFMLKMVFQLKSACFCPPVTDTTKLWHHPCRSEGEGFW